MTQNLEHILNYQIACMQDPSCRDKIRKNLSTVCRVPQVIDDLITTISNQIHHENYHRRNSQHSRGT